MNKGIVSSGKQVAIKNFSEPTLAERSVIIEHKAFGLNYDDIKVLDGRISNPNSQGILGIEASGIVVEVSKTCIRDFKVGDRVAYATYHPGAFLQRRAVNENYLMPLPKYCNFEMGATLLKGLATFTLLGRIFTIKPPAFILLTGASGGIGTYFIQFAVKCGFNVIALTSNEKKKDYLKSLGAFVVINYKKEPIEEIIKIVTKGAGIDYFFDCLGRDVQNFAFNVLKSRGFFIQFGAITGEIDKLIFPNLKEKSITVSRMMIADYIKNRKDLIYTTFGFDKGLQAKIIEPIITSYAFDNANQAFLDIKNSAVCGQKIITL